MDASKLRILPPAKRFSAMQRNHNDENMDPSPNSLPHLPLPAKKRKESRHFSTPLPSEPSITSTTTYCLPAKKRVWALQPDFEFIPLSPIDLNVPYMPPLSPSPLPLCVDDEEIAGDPKVLSGKGVSEKVDRDQVEERKELLASEYSEGANETVHQEDEDITEEDLNNAQDDDDGIVCAICESTDGDPNDPIVFCDGCDLMVHTSCYGSPLIQGIPEGDWFCNQCLVCPKVDNADSFSCCLCPKKGGALKSTVDGRWAHVVCALFVPEVFFHDSEGRDGIDFSKVPTRRWDQQCYVCEGRRGCAIDCAEPKCPLSFHVTCGFNEDLCIEYKQGKGKGAIVAGFCKTHTKLWEKQQQTGKFKIVAREEER